MWRPTWNSRTTERLLKRIRRSVIGDDVALAGPFGPRRLVYADYTASGRALSFVEDYLRDQVLPMYANTHTEATATGRHTTALREQARDLIHRSVNGSCDDVVVFCGTGVTGAVDRLVRVFGLTRRDGAVPQPDRRPVVFVGPYEHHSNELPWRESNVDLVTIREAPGGGVDLTDLAAQLILHGDRPLKIGTFSAASNVTGILTDVDAVTRLLHEHGAYACWDYASAGPYLAIDMNPAGDPLAAKDAVMISPHKFVGGPDTPGVLVAKRKLFTNPVPVVPAGGTILFVSPDTVSYHPEPSIREEGGTPAIIGSIRAGLAFAVKHAVGTDEIRRRESEFVKRAMTSWGANPRIDILGNREASRLAIISFGIRHRSGLLHGNFVAALLNDLFGIQARSGCFCAGPYLHRGFPINDRWSRRMEEEIVRGRMGAKLSFVRIGFSYFARDAVVDYLIEAVHMVADHGWKLLPQYVFDPATGLWHHHTAAAAGTRAGAGAGAGTPTLTDALRPAGPHPLARACAGDRVLRRQLAAAARIFKQAKRFEARVCDPHRAPVVDFDSIRWFPLPDEVNAEYAPACPPLDTEPVHRPGVLLPE